MQNKTEINMEVIKTKIESLQNLINKKRLSGSELAETKGYLNALLDIADGMYS